jgi:hypothetical protein
MVFKVIINKVAVGNKEEAFVESDFSSGINIISSDDNNKGKTILIQSMMYALGNEPTFPTSFDYQKYYYYIEFKENDIVFKLCRYKNSFLLKYNAMLVPFENVSELKRYWTKNIFELPEIIKNQTKRIVDPVLFLQLFFVGQDKKDTSNISHSGYYKKQDYYDMIYNVCGVSGIDLDETEIKKLNESLNKLKSDKNLLIEQYDILKSDTKSIGYLSALNDKLSFKKKISEMEKIRETIEELRKARSKVAIRQSKWKTTLKELNSLNRNIDHGELRCMDCNSTHISFSISKKKSYSFDISSSEMRSEIISSINEKISSFSEEIEHITSELNLHQNELQELMSDESITLESIVVFKQNIFNASDAEKKINEIDEQIENTQSKIKYALETTQTKKDKQSETINNIICLMNDIYNQIDPSGNLHFDDLFTKKNEIYSGSEATIFHLVKLYAIRCILEHNYPIIIDSFRAEDLSTQKENRVIDIYKNIPNQVIFTTTLKEQELGKYDNMEEINHIDYKGHTPSKMLSNEYLDSFMELVNDISFIL